MKRKGKMGREGRGGEEQVSLIFFHAEETKPSLMQPRSPYFHALQAPRLESGTNSNCNT
jgi:hypothetical protein